MQMKRVIAWGFGWQSTTMAVMSALGDLPKVDLILGSDPGWERRKTYETIEFYKPWIEAHGVPVAILTTGDIRRQGASEHIHIPFWTETGAPLQRQCTNHFKIMPARRYLRQWLGYPESKAPHPRKGAIEQWMGYTIDERYRMEASNVQYIVHRFPLIEKNFARWDCPTYLKAHGLPLPVKSACIGCPYRDASEWLEMATNDPDEFEDACRFDEENRDNPLAARGAPSTADSLYIWRGGNIPLREVDLVGEAERERRRVKVAQLGFPFPAGCNDGWCKV
jgi:hypothetical protein